MKQTPVVILCGFLLASACEARPAGDPGNAPADPVAEACSMSSLDWSDSDDRARMQTWARAALGGERLKEGVSRELNRAATDLALALDVLEPVPSPWDPSVEVEHIKRKQSALRDACA